MKIIVKFMAKNFSILLMSFGMLMLLSCDKKDKKYVGPAIEYTTSTGKVIMISEMHPHGQSLSSIRITTKDFEHNIDETIVDSDPISEVFLADLDGNGFEEIYIATASSGSGTYGNILGFASNKDKSLSMINFPAIAIDDERFSGYMGHDAFSVERGKLVRTFPIYEEQGANQKASGGKRKIVYGLFPGEAAWQLEVEESESLK